MLSGDFLSNNIAPLAFNKPKHEHKAKAREQYDDRNAEQFEQRFFGPFRVGDEFVGSRSAAGVATSTLALKRDEFVLYWQTYLVEPLLPCEYRWIDLVSKRLSDNSR
jgi:hypothetical protein